MVNKSTNYLLFELQENILYKKYIIDIIKSRQQIHWWKQQIYFLCQQVFRCKMKEAHGKTQQEFTMYIIFQFLE